MYLYHVYCETPGCVVERAFGGIFSVLFLYWLSGKKITLFFPIFVSSSSNSEVFNAVSRFCLFAFVQCMQFFLNPAFWNMWSYLPLCPLSNSKHFCFCFSFDFLVTEFWLAWKHVCKDQCWSSQLSSLPAATQTLWWSIFLSAWSKKELSNVIFYLLWASPIHIGFDNLVGKIKMKVVFTGLVYLCDWVQTLYGGYRHGQDQAQSSFGDSVF